MAVKNRRVRTFAAVPEGSRKNAVFRLFDLGPVGWASRFRRSEAGDCFVRRIAALKDAAEKRIPGACRCGHGRERQYMRPADKTRYGG